MLKVLTYLSTLQFNHGSTHLFRFERQSASRVQGTHAPVGSPGASHGRERSSQSMTPGTAMTRVIAHIAATEVATHGMPGPSLMASKITTTLLLARRRRRRSCGWWRARGGLLGAMRVCSFESPVHFGSYLGAARGIDLQRFLAGSMAVAVFGCDDFCSHLGIGRLFGG